MTKLSEVRLKLAILAAVCAIAIHPAASAQVPASTADTVGKNPSVHADSTSGKQTLDPITVRSKRKRSPYGTGYSRTATKMPALARDVPQTLIAVTRELIRDQSMQSLADVVRYIPGVTVGQGEGNRDQIIMRGNSSTADFFVDGIRDDVQYFRDLYNLERVEALKGSNAMVFGRGGGGGVLNRVTKEAGWNSGRGIVVEGGSYDKRRVSADVQQVASKFLTSRLNSVYEKAGSFRDGVAFERSGVNPVVTIASLSKKTQVTVGYEFFRDHRTADRGIPSYLGAPIETDRSRFFGSADGSLSNVVTNGGTLTASHDAGRFQIRNRSSYTSYDKNYENVFPGAVDVLGKNVAISAYRHGTDRRNAFSQTDFTWSSTMGTLSHDVLAGIEAGRQSTENFRETGYFGNGGTSTSVSVANPIVAAPVAYRQSTSDANNGTVVQTRSIYLQDQISITPQLRLIGGARYEAFDLRFRDDRSTTRLSRKDGMFSPRIGFVVKPDELLSVYGSYSLSFLPGSGDQFGSLTEITKGLEPERFSNYEAGIKWDALDRLALTAAAYRLDRSNTRAVDPSNPTRIVQTGEQRSEGVELSANGAVTSAWQISAGYTRQTAAISRATAASPAGASVPLVPSVTASLWNRFTVSTRAGLALGVVRQSQVFAAIDNKVTLPAFTRFDGAAYSNLFAGLKAQINVENILNVEYFPTSNGNNNIQPGAPRSLRASLSASF